MMRRVRKCVRRMARVSLLVVASRLQDKPSAAESGGLGAAAKSSQVNTLPKAKSKTRSKQNKDMHKCSSVYSERGVPLPVFTSGGE